jgi:hypothetical protein
MEPDSHRSLAFDAGKGSDLKGTLIPMSHLDLQPWRRRSRAQRR